MNLNIGGLIGALVGAAAVVGVMFALMEDPPVNRSMTKFFVFGLTGGAVVGNAGWSFLFNKK